MLAEIVMKATPPRIVDEAVPSKMAQKQRAVRRNGARADHRVT
jgi:hypothetical protein